ncbi:MAG: acylphosphatase [Candidatus Diapherotrites archaeon]|nr:acylphosphatase [Candidatus Diapherotrites archaeon]
MLKRFEIIVKGDVQKVAFRQFVKFLAKGYGLHGKAENLRNYDEDVLIILEGSNQKIRKFLQRLANPNEEDRARTAAKIGKIIAKEMPYGGEFRDREFEVVSKGNELQERLDEGVLLLKQIDGNLKTLTGETKKGFDKTDGNFKELSGETRRGFDRMDRNFKSLEDKTENGFKSLGEETKKGFGKTDKNFKSLGAKIDGNFGSLDKKYGSVSKTLKSMDKNLEKIVAGI